MSVASLPTLQSIRTKVRRLTRSPAEAQLATSQLDDYINTFILYDFPEHLRLFDLRTTFTFYTTPFVDVYETNTVDTTSPLYDFKNKYITVHPPVYASGFQVYFTQDPNQFWSVYPFVNSINSIGTAGDGVTDQFSGVINTQSNNVNASNPLTQQGCLLRNNVLFSSLDDDGNGLAMIDFPISATIGNLYVPGGAPTSTTVQDTDNFIDYVTGEFTVTFTSAPTSGATINSQTVPVVTSLPQAMLYYDDKFTVRPVPNQPYGIQMEVYQRPTAFLDSVDPNEAKPQLSQWWQYIAYGAAKKVFEDRMDQESVQLIMPEYKKQEALVLRKTIVQYTNDRTSTIYTQQVDNFGPQGSGWGSGW